MDSGEAEACDHVLLMNAGKLLYAGTPSGRTDRVEGRVRRLMLTEKDVPPSKG